MATRKMIHNPKTTPLTSSGQRGMDGALPAGTLGSAQSYLGGAAACSGAAGTLVLSAADVLKTCFLSPPARGVNLPAFGPGCIPRAA
jgi:hypothetical protein